MNLTAFKFKRFNCSLGANWGARDTLGQLGDPGEFIAMGQMGQMEFYVPGRPGPLAIT